MASCGRIVICTRFSATCYTKAVVEGLLSTPARITRQLGLVPSPIGFEKRLRWSCGVTFLFRLREIHETIILCGRLDREYFHVWMIESIRRKGDGHMVYLLSAYAA